MVKGTSSKELRKLHWGRIKHKPWGSSFWSYGYFYESICRVTSDAIEYYIHPAAGKALERRNLRNHAQ